MKIDPKVLKDIKRFLHWAEVHADPLWHGESYYYEEMRKFVRVVAPPYHIRVHPQTGDIWPNKGRRFAYCGNIADFANGHEWRRGKIGISSVCVPIKKVDRYCQACGGDRNVIESGQVAKCQYCRAAETRGRKRPRKKERSCNVCGRTKAVKDTTLGPRCQYCRAADSRHIGIVRRLGGTPHVDGKPLGDYYSRGS